MASLLLFSLKVFNTPGKKHNAIETYTKHETLIIEVGGQAVLGRQSAYATPWLTERHGYDPTCCLYNGFTSSFFFKSI